VIVRYGPTVTLMDCEALAVQLRRPVSTIRAHCEPIAADVATRRLLFDADAMAERLASIKQRAPHRRNLTRQTL
jgi:hypothetical protein